MPYNNTPIAPPREFTGSGSLPRKIRLFTPLSTSSSSSSSNTLTVGDRASPTDPKPLPRRNRPTFVTAQLRFANRPTPAGRNQKSVARVKKIIAADEDIGACSANAAFAIAIATEMLVSKALFASPRISFRVSHLQSILTPNSTPASAVARLDNLEFLSDVVPRTMTYKQYKDRKSAKDTAPASKTGEQQQQQTPAQQRPLSNGQKTLDQMTAASAGGTRRSGAESSASRSRQPRQSQSKETVDPAWEEADPDVEMDGYQDEEEEEKPARWGDGYAYDELADPGVSPSQQRPNAPHTGSYVQVAVPLRGPAPVTSPAAPALAPAQRQETTRTRGPLARHAYDAVRDRFE